MLHLDDLAIFVTIVEQKSFTKAAISLSIPKATLSRRFSDFEKRINKKLLERSTRALSLTDDGKHLYEVAATNVHHGLAVQSSLLHKTSKIAGKVRLTCNNAIGEHLLQHHLALFKTEYPHVELILNLTEKPLNVIDNQFDVAIRMGELKDSHYVEKPLTKTRRWLVATPEYLANAPKVSQPEDIENLRAIIQSEKHAVLDFGNTSVKLQWDYCVNNLNAVLTLVKKNLGIAWLPDFLIQEEVRNAHLFCLFPQYPFEPVQASLVMQKQKFRTPQAQALIDFLLNAVPKKHLLRLAG